MLLQKLYDNLQQKDKVILQKRVTQLEHTKDGVRVVTQDGSFYEGDMIVGADGVYSTVRKQMHRLAHASSPAYFGKDEYASKFVMQQQE